MARRRPWLLIPAATRLAGISHASDGIYEYVSLLAGYGGPSDLCGVAPPLGERHTRRTRGCPETATLRARSRRTGPTKQMRAVHGAHLRGSRCGWRSPFKGGAVDPSICCASAAGRRTECSASERGGCRLQALVRALKPQQ
jgi:hypothetical protein